MKSILKGLVFFGIWAFILFAYDALSSPCTSKNPYLILGIICGFLIGIQQVFSAFLLSLLALLLLKILKISAKFGSSYSKLLLLHGIFTICLFVTLGIAALGGLYFLRRLCLTGKLDPFPSLKAFLETFSGLSDKPTSIFRTGRHFPSDLQISQDFFVLELDDQGMAFDPGKITSIIQDIEKAAATPEAQIVIITFIHGWNHNAAPTDRNLIDFSNYIARLRAVSPGKAVMGIYVGWQGQRYNNFIQKSITFYDRSRRTRIISEGSLLELVTRLGELRVMYNTSPAGGGKNQGRIRVYHWGHSFGGAILYAAMSREISSYCRGVLGQTCCDRVFLINPATEGIFFLSTYQALNALPLSSLPSSEGHDPFFLCLTSRTDRDLSRLFRLAKFLRITTESYRTALEEICLYTPLGLVPQFVTHNGQSVNGALVLTAVSQSGVPYLRNPRVTVAMVDEAVIKDHNDIFKDELLKYFS
ncbi:hypothetical protein GMO_17250 [Gluconobacter morbifer G707]|uniref:Transmembrane protein n=1 Tax=Gluconobacter morbifer G707 TaxID=1088869 RepID=G6XJZ6_9PROT|nr:hypothetical protein GMO_17250 [Gluconobacter morbifer G707]